VWSAGITDLPLRGGFMYLAATIDWFSRLVVAWRLSNTLDGSFCQDMLSCGEYGDYRHCCDCGQLFGELPVPEERTKTATSLTTGARTAGLTCSQGMIDEPRRTA
jgi:hypothetical protein